MTNVSSAPLKIQEDVAAGAGLGGKTTIEDGVVAKIAGIAAREVRGVYALGGGAARMVGAIRDTVVHLDDSTPLEETQC